MFEQIKAIVEDMQQRSNTAPSDIARVNKQEHHVDSKRVLTALSGKQKEPNRGAGSDRKPSVPRAHTTGPTNEHAVVASHADSDGNSYSHVAATGNTHYIVQTHHNYTTLKRPIVSHEGPEKHVEKHWKHLVGESLDEAKSTHTHKGHCQVCGRQQAVDNTSGLMAKHGYKLEGHEGSKWFSGTCHGAKCKPLEHDHSVTDQVISSMHSEHKRHTQLAHEYHTGVRKPKEAWGGGWTKDQKGRTVQHMVPFHEAPPHRQSDAVRHAHGDHEMIARHSKSHAEHLERMKKEIHGKPLVSAQHQAEVRKKASGERKAKTDHKDHLRSLARQFDNHVNDLQGHFLKIPHEHRTEAQSKVYYAPQFHHWNEKHSAAARKEFPAAKETIDAIDHLAAQRKAMTKKEEVQMNDFEFKQLEEGIKAKMSPQDAHDFLTQHDAHRDFHTLPSETVQHMRDKSYEVGFKHNPKTSNGSRGRYFHAALQRHARRGAVKEAKTYSDGTGTPGAMSNVYKKNEWLHKAETHIRKAHPEHKIAWATLHLIHGTHGHSPEAGAKEYAKQLNLKEDRNNEYSAHSQLSSSRSSRKAGHYLMKHGSPMHSEPHKDSAAALHAYKSLGDSKGVSIHHVKEDLEEVPGVVKTLSELKKSTLASYVKKSVERVDTDSYNTGKRFNQKPRSDAQTAHRKYLNHRQGINRAVDKLAKEETVVEGVAEHEKFKDHTKNPYHETLTKHGFVHQKTTHTQNPFARDNPRADDTEHVYTHPQHGKSHVIVHQEHDPTVGHGGMKSKGHHFLHRYEQPNGIMAPSSGENKNHLHRSLSYHYGVPKGMEAPKLTAAEKKYAHIRPNYKMNEDAPAMSAGGAGDPGHVQNATDNYASQMDKRKSHIKDMLRRKKPVDEANNLVGHVPAELNDQEVGVVSPEQLEINRKKAALPKKVGPGGVDEENTTKIVLAHALRHERGQKDFAVFKKELQKTKDQDATAHERAAAHWGFDPKTGKKVNEATGQYSSHHSRAQWLRVATQHGYAISPDESSGKGNMRAHHPVHGYHVGHWHHKEHSGWISKPHPDWSK